jgi:hypothetical protein
MFSAKPPMLVWRRYHSVGKTEREREIGNCGVLEEKIERGSVVGDGEGDKSGNSVHLFHSTKNFHSLFPLLTLQKQNHNNKDKHNWQTFKILSLGKR